MDTQLDARIDTAMDVAVDSLLSATSTPDAPPIPQLNPMTMHAWMDDVAQKIHGYDVIAARYGFASWQVMAGYMRDNPEIKRRITARRAIWESDANVEVRARTYAAHSVIEAIPHTSQVMFDPTATPTAKLDALKVHARIAGLDGMPAQGRDGAGPAGIAPSGRFSINFLFSDRTEKITTIEHVATEVPA